MFNFPLGKLISISGVSGSGKSTLINETLYPIIAQHINGSRVYPLEYSSIEGLKFIDKIIQIDQKPIGRTPRSNQQLIQDFLLLFEIYLPNYLILKLKDINLVVFHSMLKEAGVNLVKGTE